MKEEDNPTPGSFSARDKSPDHPDNKLLKKIANSVKKDFKLKEYTFNVWIKETYERLKSLKVEEWKNIPKCVKSILIDII